MYVLLKLSMEGVAFKQWITGMDTSLPHYFIVMLMQMVFKSHIVFGLDIFPPIPVSSSDIYGTYFPLNS